VGVGLADVLDARLAPAAHGRTARGGKSGENEGGTSEKACPSQHGTSAGRGTIRPNQARFRAGFVAFARAKATSFACEQQTAPSLAKGGIVVRERVVIDVTRHAGARPESNHAGAGARSPRAARRRVPPSPRAASGLSPRRPKHSR